MNPTLDIIIVNWNSGKLLQSCLQSIMKTKKENFLLSKVIVVDNASQDASIDNLDKINLPIMLIRNDKNIGFACACNQGASKSSADYLLFLNPDTNLYENALVNPIYIMKQDIKKKVGIIGIQLVNKKGDVIRSCTRLPSPVHYFIKILGLDNILPKIFQNHRMLSWDHLESRYVDHVMGSFFFLRQTLFKELGGFDARFFVYLEDLDFCLRVRKAGKLILYLTDVKAYHEGGGVSKQIKAKRLFYSLRSRILYCYKHFSWWAATGVVIGTLMVEPFTRLIWAGLRRSIKEAYQTIQAYGLLLRALPAILKETNCGLKDNNMKLKK